jgi:lipoprotein-anchoring transpeptidase ErfK/SrfK
MWVYERGVVRWEWVISTGVWDSPTMPGVFQILSHHVSAYAGNWDLDMPYFMGIYETVPGFTNGIHGMVTRRGASLLWENALGRPVTYGCILLSNAHVKTLYEWAPEGVVVEVRN